MEVLRIDSKATDAQAQFSKSLKDTGFAVLYNHPIDQELITETYQEWVAFFNSQDKEHYRYHRDTQDGFFPKSVSETAKGHQEKDIKEFYQFYPWGQFPTSMSQNTQELYDQLQKFAVLLLNWVQTALPKEIEQCLSMPLSQMIENTSKTMLRILHYPPLSGTEPANAVRAAAHGDINLLTLLVGATNSGLQVQDITGEWYPVPTDKESIAVNIGDMLELCTQGYYTSTLHRVINPEQSNEARLSMPLFLHPGPEVKLEGDFTAKAFLQQRLKEIGVA